MLNQMLHVLCFSYGAHLGYLSGPITELMNDMQVYSHFLKKLLPRSPITRHFFSTGSETYSVCGRSPTLEQTSRRRDEKGEWVEFRGETAVQVGLAPKNEAVDRQARNHQRDHLGQAGVEKSARHARRQSSIFGHRIGACFAGCKITYLNICR